MRLRCLVDNSVRPGSAFWGEHGLSFLVETDNHCTGPAAFVALSQAFEERVLHCPAGTTLEL